MEKLVLPSEYNYIAAFLTMRCKLNCSFCLNAFDKSFRRKRDEISGEKLVDGLNRIESRAEVPVTLSGGEPFLHPDFFYIINNLKKDLNIDILTNLQWGAKGIERFISEVNPERLKRKSPYPSIRVSYHPQEMKDPEAVAKNVKKMQDAGFSIGLYSVQYPSQKVLEAITRMQFICRFLGVDFRVKNFTGKFGGKDDLGRDFSLTYGDYSKYPNSCFQEKIKQCECRTSEFILGPNGGVYKCHRDLFAEESPIGNLLNPEFKLIYEFRKCGKYGQCHPCDVMVKTNYKQQLGHTSVEIKDIK